MASLIVLVSFSIFLITRHVAPEASSIPNSHIGHQAPTFVGHTIDGVNFSLAKERGNVVFVDFWASWCTPCRQEALDLSSFAWEQRHHHVVFIGVLWNDELSAARRFEREFGSLYQTVIDPGGSIANLYGVTAPPTIFVINAQGRVIATLIGRTTDHQLTSLLKKIRS